jgi:hypothetical protein
VEREPTYAELKAEVARLRAVNDNLWRGLRDTRVSYRNDGFDAEREAGLLRASVESWKDAWYKLRWIIGDVWWRLSPGRTPTTGKG